jgi:L-alanine-DL-glutamate epimerase-like enolase superfamily enzyme
MPADLPPATRAGVELALLDLEAQHQGVPLARLFGEVISPRIPVNALLTAPFEAPSYVVSGFRTLKLKLTSAADVDAVAALRAKVGPDVALRLDANGAWGEEEAIAILHALAPYAPEYVEQPTPAGDMAMLARVGRATGVPVAADEALRSPADVQRALDAGVPVLVIKPVALGGLRATQAALTLADAAGAKAVLTSALDRGRPSTGALHLLATRPVEHAHGLATTGLLPGGLPPTPWLDVPEGPGLC